jgi:hypothetical protein
LGNKKVLGESAPAAAECGAKFVKVAEVATRISITNSALLRMFKL